ncbi:NirA family protein [Roseomonas indoligenes]|uniref:NirA family protein n=1 Tax=Roseomonas indoligenes TaxID=2820811 RepID=A0A940S894_9PROT|nr:NirA family protein [Pararoseomonas indoligenes]MBP0495854.1 NirA family protein [Pararoseomonas indoligenes]
MDGSFTPEQQNYLQGFMAGVEARRGTLSPGGAAEGGAPPDAMRAAQDAAVAAGGKLSPEERMKREKHPLDRWDEVEARARAGKFPHGLENLATRWHGLFYVGPTQDSFMCRLRIPGGILSTHQARGIAAIAEECGGGYVDATTRNNLQIREIPADKGLELLERLADLGIIPKGTGADNIRNITASPTSGIDPHELIDTRAIVRKLHHHILNTRDLFGLPRKFNISIDGGSRVAVVEDTNDIAFAAVKVGEEVLFRLALGGITGHRDFARDTGRVVAADEVVKVCDAILRVFLAHGDRTDRRKSRLKYLLDTWGLPRFIEAVEAQLGAPLREVDGGESAPPADKHGHLGVHDQKQDGLQYVGVVLPVGRITADELRALARIADTYGSGTLRLTVWQNLLISDIPRDRMAEACREIEAIGFGTTASHVRGGLVACTGAAGCKFAAAHTKQHAAALADYLDSRIAVSRPINIHLTGCHNSCAQHYIGDIGLIGAKVERGEEEVEGYDLHVGGGAGMEQRIGRLVLPKVAHDDLGPAVLNLLRAWQAEAAELTFQAFTDRHGEAELLAMTGRSAAEIDA